MRCAVFFVLVAALASVALGQLTFEGAWTSDYGGSTSARFFFCYNNATGRLQGVYSNIGFVDGFVTNDTTTGRPRFTGTWFEGGPGTTSPSNTLNPSYGPITLLLSADGNSFAGTYAFAGNSLTPGDGTWAETRVSTARPTTDQCWASDSTSAVQDKVWEIAGDATWSICSGSDITSPPGGVVGSYSYSDGTVGSVAGGCNSTAGVCYLIFAEKPQNSGIMLLRVVGDTMFMSAFTSGIDNFVWTNDTNIYGFSKWTVKAGGAPTLATCIAQRSYVCKFATCPKTSAGVALSVSLLVALIAFILAAML